MAEVTTEEYLAASRFEGRKTEKRMSTKEGPVIPNINNAFSSGHIQASIILSRLPVSFHPYDVLIVSEEFSPDLFEAFSILLNGVMVSVVSPHTEEVKPRKNHTTLGYFLSHTLNEALALKSKISNVIAAHDKEEKKRIAQKSGLFDLIVFNAKNGGTVMHAGKKVIDSYLRSSGIALISCPDEILNIPVSYHVLSVSKYVCILFETKDNIVAIQRGE